MIPPAALEQFRAGRPAQAAATLRRALAKSPGDHECAHLLAVCLSQSAEHAQALFMFERAIALAPARADYRANHAEALRLADKPEAALAAADQAVALAPDLAQAHVARGEALRALGRPASAISAFEHAVTLDPALVMPRVHRADLLVALGRPERALEAGRETVLADPTNPMQRVTLATLHLFASGVSPDDLRAAHIAAADAFGRAPLPTLPGSPGNSPLDPNRPLRVAYLSPDLVEHSVVRFLEPIIDHHDRAHFEPVALFASDHGDATTARLRPKFARWHDLPRPDEAEIAALLQRERVDIAIDLAGHTNHSIVYPLRQRVVPVQMTYLGYPATTGLPGVQHRLVDSLTDPPGSDSQATEHLLRLDPCFLCFRRPDAAPDVAPPPSARSPHTGHAITFGSFNFLGKISHATKSLWARVLAAVPGSRLLLKDSSLEHEEARDAVRADFAALGVDASRLEFRGRVPDRAAHLAMYGDVDIALDPTPYAGTTTTCEALWMGVPVVTLAGATHHARVGVSLLSAVGRPELIAPDEAAYVALAAALASDPARLASLRAGLRGAMAASPLCDEAGFTRRFEAALRRCWHEACDRRVPGA
jgi:protein O-GlcNAc transferase